MAALPQGVLPKALVLVSVLAGFNCVQNYIDHSFSRRVYTKGGAQVTPLTARTFGTWNLLSAAVRLYCAYDIHNKALYHLCMLTFVLALAHFLAEVLVFRTANPRSPGMISPLVVASSTLTGMALQYRHYIVD